MFSPASGLEVGREEREWGGKVDATGAFSTHPPWTEGNQCSLQAASSLQGGGKKQLENMALIWELNELWYTEPQNQTQQLGLLTQAQASVDHPRHPQRAAAETYTWRRKGRKQGTCCRHLLAKKRKARKVFPSGAGPVCPSKVTSQVYHFIWRRWRGQVGERAREHGNHLCPPPWKETIGMGKEVLLLIVMNWKEGLRPWEPPQSLELRFSSEANTR